MSRSWTEAEIAAFLDGELQGGEADLIAAALDSDPEARALADRIAQTDALLRDAFAAPLDEPVPAAMRAAVLGAPGKVTALPARRPRPVWAPMALAASVALLVGLGAGRALFEPGATPATLALGVGPAPEAAVAAFETAPSGAARGALRPLASFDTVEGPCREFETLDAEGAARGVGLACRGGDGRWRVEVLAEAPGATEGREGYAPASGAGADAIGAALDAFDAGPALAPDAEAARIAAGWR